ncbi:MAG: hypothetical protein ACJ74Y_11845, partial [Bryobacteraceae bacterium]
VSMKNSQVARLLAYVSGMVNRQLLLQNQYLLAENRILRSQSTTFLGYGGNAQEDQVVLP